MGGSPQLRSADKQRAAAQLQHGHQTPAAQGTDRQARGTLAAVAEIGGRVKKNIIIPCHDFRVIDSILSRLIHTCENPEFTNQMWAPIINEENLKEFKKIRKHIRRLGEE